MPLLIGQPCSFLLNLDLTWIPRFFEETDGRTSALSLPFVPQETSCLKIVHFVDEEDVVPSELEANAKSMCSSNLVHRVIRADFDI